MGLYPCAATTSDKGLAWVQAVLCRRRHQPRRPPLAKTKPGTPAPATGPGTPTGGRLSGRGGLGGGGAGDWPIIQVPGLLKLVAFMPGLPDRATKIPSDDELAHPLVRQ